MARVQSGPVKVAQLLSSGTRLSNLLIYPTFVAIASTAPLLVPVVFDPKSLSAVAILQIMTLFGIAGI